MLVEASVLFLVGEFSTAVGLVAGGGNTWNLQRVFSNWKSWSPMFVEIFCNDFTNSEYASCNGASLAANVLKNGELSDSSWWMTSSFYICRLASHSEGIPVATSNHFCWDRLRHVVLKEGVIEAGFCAAGSGETDLLREKNFQFFTQFVTEGWRVKWLACFICFISTTFCIKTSLILSSSNVTFNP